MKHKRSLSGRKMMVNNWALSIQLNVRFEFSATSSSEWNCCSIFQNFQKEANFARYTQIFRNFSPKIFFPFIFAPGISRIFGRMVRISDIQQIPESFLGNFCTIFLCFQILESFSSMKAHNLFIISRVVCTCILAANQEIHC